VNRWVILYNFEATIFWKLVVESDVKLWLFSNRKDILVARISGADLM
jgi:hypothetical protein